MKKKDRKNLSELAREIKAPLTSEQRKELRPLIFVVFGELAEHDTIKHYLRDPENAETLMRVLRANEGVVQIAKVIKSDRKKKYMDGELAKELLPAWASVFSSLEQMKNQNEKTPVKQMARITVEESALNGKRVITVPKDAMHPEKSSVKSTKKSRKKKSLVLCPVCKKAHLNTVRKKCMEAAMLSHTLLCENMPKDKHHKDCKLNSLSAYLSTRTDYASGTFARPSRINPDSPTIIFSLFGSIADYDIIRICFPESQLKVIRTLPGFEEACELVRKQSSWNENGTENVVPLSVKDAERLFPNIVRTLREEQHKKNERQSDIELGNMWRQAALHNMAQERLQKTLDIINAILILAPAMRVRFVREYFPHEMKNFSDAEIREFPTLPAKFRKECKRYGVI